MSKTPKLVLGADAGDEQGWYDGQARFFSRCVGREFSFFPAPDTHLMVKGGGGDRKNQVDVVSVR